MKKHSLSLPITLLLLKMINAFITSIHLITSTAFDSYFPDIINYIFRYQSLPWYLDLIQLESRTCNLYETPSYAPWHLYELTKATKIFYYIYFIIEVMFSRDVYETIIFNKKTKNTCSQQSTTFMCKCIGWPFNYEHEQ